MTDWRETLLETRTIGESFLRVTAQDADRKQPYNDLRYAIEADPAVVGYIMIDEVTGDVALRKSLMEDPDRRVIYDVSIIAR